MKIDWNKVAHDPILAQQITNGHAARMRYSRFKAALLGLEPQKRNRTNANKSRVTKSKKEGKGRKVKDGDNIKEDPDSRESGAQETAKVESPRIKQEMSQPPPDNGVLNSTFGVPSATISASAMHSQLHARLLTPCSDSDALAASSSYAASPSSDMLHNESSFDFSGPPVCAHGNEHLTWSQNNTYSPFGVDYDLDNYSPGFCGHQHSQLAGNGLTVHQPNQLAGGCLNHTHRTGEELSMSEALFQRDGNHTMVKHEDWDSTSI